jgi:predicted DsbA family dithiol-disulfide isomerase
MPVDIDLMMQNLRKTAAEFGLPLGNRKKTYNSRLAQELGKWAESKNAGDAFHAEAFKVYFVDGKNIDRLPVLLDLAESAGLNREEAESVILNRTFKKAVDEDWALSGENDIKAVPTFIMMNDRLVGAQSYSALEKWLISNGVKKSENRFYYGLEK